MANNAPEIMKQKPVIPWFYLAPAIIVMTLYIVYPMINTIALSFRDRRGINPIAETCVEGRPCWGAFENFRYALTAEINFNSVSTFWNTFWRSSYGNNIKWVFFMVSGTVLIGLLMAVLADRVKYETVAKSIIFLPMAISFVGAGVIWGFVYEFRSTGPQVGLLNAIITSLGGRPVAFMVTPEVNTYMLIIVGIWIWTGFCMTILAAALRNVPTEMLEAARVDGASEWSVFSKIMIPTIMPTLTVVITTMVINVLKLFDLVYVMTGGNYGTEVIANRMYSEMYVNFHTGRGAAVAVVLIILILPFVYFNIRRFLEQEATR